MTLRRFKPFFAAVRGPGEKLVILLDQFEQLSLDDNRHSGIFDFLQLVAAREKPCDVICVIAYRTGYAGEWNKFTASLDEPPASSTPKLLPLELFNKSKKKRSCGRPCQGYSCHDG